MAAAGCTHIQVDEPVFARRPHDAVGFMKADRDAYLQLADEIEKSTIQAISLEDAHQHNDISLLEYFSTTKIIFGAVGIARPHIETVKEITDRLRMALNHIDADRRIVAPDCGLTC